MSFLTFSDSSLYLSLTFPLLFQTLLCTYPWLFPNFFRLFSGLIPTFSDSSQYLFLLFQTLLSTYPWLFPTFSDSSQDLSILFSDSSELYPSLFQLFQTLPFTYLWHFWNLFCFFTHRLHPTSCFTHWTVYQYMFSFTQILGETYLCHIRVHENAFFQFLKDLIVGFEYISYQNVHKIT